MPSMTDNKELSPRGRLGIGLLVAALGAFICLIGLGIITSNAKDVHAPLWVVTSAGAAFLFAGLTLALSAASPTTDADGGLPPSAPFVLRLLQYLLGLAIVAALASVGSWVAFGPGERNFSVTLSLPWWGSTGKGNDLIGRVVFGIGAVLTWLFFIAVAVKGWRRLFKRAAKPDSRYSNATARCASPRI
jgi:hypothetical protein